MHEQPFKEPIETAGREGYYDAALVNIILFCDHCDATLDPDVDLGPGVSFESPGSYILLGDEAFRRGWSVSPPGLQPRKRNEFAPLDPPPS